MKGSSISEHEVEDKLIRSDSSRPPYTLIPDWQSKHVNSTGSDYHATSPIVGQIRWAISPMYFNLKGKVFLSVLFLLLGAASDRHQGCPGHTADPSHRTTRVQMLLTFSNPNKGNLPLIKLNVFFFGTLTDYSFWNSKGVDIACSAIVDIVP